MRQFLAATLLLGLAACATPPKGDDLAAYPAALVGTYDNAAQYAQAPDDLKRPPVADDAYDWIDQQTVTFSSVSAPALGPAVIHAEWRGVDGAVSRQRVWSFRRDSGGVQLDLYAPRDPARLAGAAAFAALTAGDLIGYGPTCALTVSSSGRGAWNAQTDTETCRTPAQDGTGIAIDARITVMPTGVLYQEAGRRPEGGPDGSANGSFVFRLPGGPPYDFRRRP